MSAQSPYSDEEDSPRFNYPPHRQRNESTEFKAPYLGDDEDYTFQAQTQTFNVDPQSMYTGEHRRGPSYPLQNQPYSMKQAAESEADQSISHYPPLVQQKDSNDTETKGFWRKVRCVYFQYIA